MATQEWQTQVIKALNSLWVSLPLKGNTDQQATLDSYGYALEGNSIEAIRNVVKHLCRGEIEKASTVYSPRAPELAGYVREEQKRLDALNRRPALPPRAVNHEFKDWRIIHRQKADELAAKGYTLHAENVSDSEFHNRAKRRDWPVGSIWYWSNSEVWSPA